jgi:hypothetical protein
VAGLGWLGLAQPMWAELGPAPKKKYKKIKNKKNKKNRKCRYKNFACLRKLYIFFPSIYSLISGS